MASLVQKDKDEIASPDVAQPSEDVIAADQMTSTVVITGLPICEEAAILAALDEAFASVGAGAPAQTILQCDSQTQAAVVIMTSPDDAENICCLNGTKILGNTIGAVLASALQPPAEDSVPEPAAESKVVSVEPMVPPVPGDDPNPVPTDPEEATGGTGVSSLLARAKVGFARAAASVAVNAVAVDQRHGISKNISAAALTAKARALTINEQYGISERVRNAAAAVDRGIKQVDDKYRVQERANAAVKSITQQGNKLGEKALKNEKIRKGWGWGKRLAGRAASAAAAAVSKVSQEVDSVTNMTREEYQRRSSSSQPLQGE